MPRAPSRKPSIPNGKPSSKGRLQAFIVDALWVDFRSGQQVSSVSRLAVSPLALDRKARNGFPLGPPCSNANLLEGQIRQQYPLWPEERVDGVVLVLKLGIAYAASGLSTVSCEARMVGLAKTLGLPSLHVSMSGKALHASFGGGPQHVMGCLHQKQIDRMTDTHFVATSLATGACTDMLAALAALDEIQSRPKPFGWLWEMAGFHAFALFGAISGYAGSWQVDVLAIIILVPAMQAVIWICGALPLFSRIQYLLVPATIGFLLPLVVDNILGAELCHVTTVYLSLLLISLPGTELLLGVEELQHGSMVGAARLIHCIIRIMSTALGLTLGWQATGGRIDGLAESVATRQLRSAMTIQTPTYLVPTDLCSPWQPWWLASGVYAVPWTLSALLILGVRIRDWPLPVMACTAALTLEGAFLEFWPATPAYVINFVVTYAGSLMCCVFEFASGKSHMLTFVPLIVMLAPGASALRLILESMDANGTGDAPGGAIFQLLMNGVSFAAGMHAALEMLRPLMDERAAARAQAETGTKSARPTTGTMDQEDARETDPRGHHLVSNSPSKLNITV
jgi:uncharacterized membrane protein YjjP (DUF1212 family)